MHSGKRSCRSSVSRRMVPPPPPHAHFVSWLTATQLSTLPSHARPLGESARRGDDQALADSQETNSVTGEKSVPASQPARITQPLFNPTRWINTAFHFGNRAVQNTGSAGGSCAPTHHRDSYRHTTRLYRTMHVQGNTFPCSGTTWTVTSPRW